MRCKVERGESWAFGRRQVWTGRGRLLERCGGVAAPAPFRAGDDRFVRVGRNRGCGVLLVTLRIIITCACGRGGGPARHVCPGRRQGRAGPVVVAGSAAEDPLRAPRCGWAPRWTAGVFRVRGGRVRMRREDRAGRGLSRPTAVGLAQLERRHQGAVIRAAAAGSFSSPWGPRAAPRLASPPEDCRLLYYMRWLSWCA
jgi:hypothetical protein